MTSNPHDVRSRIINYSIWVEMFLTEFIRKYFVKEENKSKEFEDFILSKEFFTFEQKINVFTRILRKSKEINIRDGAGEEFNAMKDYKIFIEKVRYIKDIRNILAHNHPFTKRTGEPYVGYTKDDKKKELILNEEFDQQFFMKYIYVSDTLRRLIKCFD